MPDKWKYIIGGTLVAGLIALCIAIALGHVEEKTSFGLTGIVVILGSIATKFADWAFHIPEKKPEDEEKKG